MTHEQFEHLVLEGIRELPSWVREKLVNVAFLIADEPSRTQRRENDIHDDETLFGLYEGVPLVERGNESPGMPDTITIFRRPILNTYDTEADIRACVANTIWHEVAHYFGHGEEWVESEEQKRGRTT